MQSDQQSPVVLITGTSSGIGAACARHLTGTGYCVYGASRSIQEPFERFTPLQLDVTDDASVHAGVQQVIKERGKIDVLINNAGIAYAGAVEDTTIDEAYHQFDVNFFGVFRMSKAVLPIMREQGRGCILTIGSIGGLIGLPYQAFYSATKFALEGLMEGLRLEVRNTGIRVILVEPGDIRTNISTHRIISPASGPESAYFHRFNGYVESIKQSEQRAPGPERVATKIQAILKEKSPALRYRIGSPLENLAVYLRKVLPGAWFERLMASSFKV